MRKEASDMTISVALPVGTRFEAGAAEGIAGVGRSSRRMSDIGRIL